jgi:hypothetical protein
MATGGISSIDPPHPHPDESDTDSEKEVEINKEKTRNRKKRQAEREERQEKADKEKEDKANRERLAKFKALAAEKAEREKLPKLPKMESAEARVIRETAERAADPMGAGRTVLEQALEAHQSRMALSADAVTQLTYVLRDLSAATRARADPAPIPIPPPEFDGKVGENPTHHILKAEDWFGKMHTPNAERTAQFVNTLTGWAREWYATIDPPAGWDEMKLMFSKEYSTQGRSIKQLLQRWRTLTFDHETDNFQKFVSNVKQTAAQLSYGELAVVELIKSTMPDTLFGALLEKDTLIDVLKICTEYCAKSTVIALTTPAPTPASIITPFSRLSVKGAEKQVQFNNSEIIDDALEQMKASNNEALEQIKESLYAQSDETQTPRKPWKPYVTPKKTRGNWDNNRGGNRGNNNRGNSNYRGNSYRGNNRGNNRGNRNNYRGGNREYNNYGGRSQSRDRYQNRNQTPDRSRDQGGRNNYSNDRNRSYSGNRQNVRFDKSPNNSRSRSSSRPINKDRGRCFYCNNFGHWRDQCPQRPEGGDQRNDHQSPNRHNTHTVDYQPGTRFEYKVGADGNAFMEQLNH